MNTNIKEIRILMIGPGEGVISGIFSLVETFLPVLEKRVSLLYLPSVKQRQLKNSGKLSFRNLVIAFSLYVRFLSAMLRFRPHIIHLHTSQGIAWLKDTFIVIIGKILRARVILHMHGGNFDAIYEANPRIIQIYTRMILGLADAVIAVSTEWKMRLANLIPADRVYSFRNCIDIQKIQSTNNCNERLATNIIFIGRIGPLKGAFDLIEAIHCVQVGGSVFHTWMVGPEERDGDLKYAHDLVDRYLLADQCELLGPVVRDEVLQLFRKASIFVLPSYYEGLPMVILEALAMGLPVIATPVGGIPEVIQDTFNGILIPPGNIEALANALEILVKDADLRKTMGAHSREIAEHELDVCAYVEKLVVLYASLS